MTADEYQTCFICPDLVPMGKGSMGKDCNKDQLYLFDIAKLGDFSRPYT